MSWNLMTDNAISENDRSVLSNFVLNSGKLTQGPFVKEFERRWSEWLGCKYSVFVNSGSSANLLIARALAEENQTWVCQASTWITNVSPVIQNNLKLILCDIDLHNFGPKLEYLEDIFQKNENCVLFLTHFIGIPAITKELLALCEKYNVTLVEDCCESHGATYQNVRVGNFGVASSFSFYYGHHMTTIEGGMVCTNDEELYNQFLLLRSHGMLRELPSEVQSRPEYHFEECDPRFTFIRDAYNVRSSDLNAKLGLEQLPRLDSIIESRNENYRAFYGRLDNSKYHFDFAVDEPYGLSSFCLPIIPKNGNLQDVKSLLDRLNVESRPFIGGNLSRHPIFQINQCNKTDLKNVEYLNYNCVYVGNHQDVNVDMVTDLADSLNCF